MSYRDCLLSLFLLATVQSVARSSDAGTDFFENKIRPVLVKHCYQCHSAKAAAKKALRGELLLDTRAGIRKGGESGPAVVPKDPKKSLLLAAIRHETFKMPPNGKLPANVIADFEKWIKLGAPDPRNGKVVVKKDAIDIRAGRRFWSFRPLKDVQPPKVAGNWSWNAVDRFIQLKLDKSKLQPVGDAPPRMLIRRLSFDLTGLPPTPDAVAAFVAACAKDRRKAVEQLVDKLLASPQFGERWGRHWLDVARYGVTSGGTKNREWPDAWRYRNYVIDAFNADKPFNEFVQEQIAGDLLPADDDNQRRRKTIATGFLAMGAKAANATRMEIIGEQLDVLGRAFLGVSIGCARCHDHKFDPVPTRDFYALAGIFQNTQIQDGKPFADLSFADSKSAKKRSSEYKNFFRKLNTATRNLWRAEHRLAEMTAKAGVRRRATESWEIAIGRLGDGARRKAEQTLKQRADARRALENLRKAGVPDVFQAVAMTDRPAKGRQFRNAPIHIRGSESNLGEEVPRGVLQVLTESPPSVGEKQSGRLQLAAVIKDHPLTSRVIVNRVWHHLFGRGLVATVDNFGTLGARPTHPELLEWLAGRFVSDGWSIKKTIRRIVLSRTYQLSSDVPASYKQAAMTDPDNALLWRHSSRRLDAESIRDSLLIASGTLRLERPDRFQTLVHFSLMNDLKAMDAVRHRAVYLPVHRGVMTDVMAVFNFPPAELVIGRRESPSVPTQALFLMNSPLVLKHSQLMAARLLGESSLDDEKRIGLAYEIVFGRRPSEAEKTEALAFVNPADSSKKNDKQHRQNAWAKLCQALFCSAEFRFVR